MSDRSTSTIGATDATSVRPSSRVRAQVTQRQSQLLARQIEAIDAWNTARAQREQLLTSHAFSRDEQLDASRRLDVLHRVHEALHGRADLALAAEATPMLVAGPVTAVLAHRHPWTRDRLAEALHDYGVEILICTDNGADALGTVVAEQPDVLFTGERLAMMGGSELLADAALFAPFTLLAVQGANVAAERHLREAEAQLVFSFGQPVTDVALQLATTAKQRVALAG